MESKSFFYKLKHLVRKRELGPVGAYSYQVISVPEELDYPETLPLEVRYILAKHPEYKEKIKNILEKNFGGKALGVKTITETPQKILDEVNHISIYSQHFTILTWLPQLLREGIAPKIKAEDIKKAKKKNVDLKIAADYILSHKYEFKKIVLIDESNEGVATSERAFMKLLNDDIFPVAIDWIVHRIIADNAHERTKVAQTIIKSLLLIGPVTHVLEIWARGIGKVFAASADDLLSETAELFALRGSGFSWKTLAKRGIVLVPVFALATYAAFMVEHQIKLDRYALAGALFGLSAVMLSLTTAIQSIFLYFRSIRDLIAENKFQSMSKWQRFVLAFKQDFTNPARLGLGIGALCSPLFAMIIFTMLPTWTHNGWVLALLGSTESIVAALTVFLSRKINKKRFEYHLKKNIG